MPLSPHTTWRDFSSGLGAYLRVPAAISKHRLWHYQLLPGLLSLLISALMIAVMAWLAIKARAWTMQSWDLRETTWGPWLSLLVGIGAFVIMAIAFFFLHKRIILILLAPFLSNISETITRAECGPQPDTSLTKWQTRKRSIVINIRSAVIELVLTVPLALVGLLPFLSPVTAPLVLLIGSRYAGNGLMDFPLEYRGLSVRESIRWSRKHMATATGVGLGYQLMIIVPILGWMFAPTFATVAGTLRAIEIHRQEASSR